jgi:DNA-binding NtrC family response regulator
MKLEIDLFALISAASSCSVGVRGAHRMLLKQVEFPFFHLLLQHTQGNQSHAARIAGISRKTLATKLKRYHLSITKQVGSL